MTELLTQATPWWPSCLQGQQWLARSHNGQCCSSLCFEAFTGQKSWARGHYPDGGLPNIGGRVDRSTATRRCCACALHMATSNQPRLNELQPHRNLSCGESTTSSQKAHLYFPNDSLHSRGWGGVFPEMKCLPPRCSASRELPMMVVVKGGFPFLFPFCFLFLFERKDRKQEGWRLGLGMATHRCPQLRASQHSIIFGQIKMQRTAISQRYDKTVLSLGFNSQAPSLWERDVCVCVRTGSGINQEE